MNPTASCLEGLFERLRFAFKHCVNCQQDQLQKHVLLPFCCVWGGGGGGGGADKMILLTKTEPPEQANNFYFSW